MYIYFRILNKRCIRGGIFLRDSDVRFRLVFRSSLDNLAHSGKTVRCLQSTWPLRGKFRCQSGVIAENRVTILD